MPSVCWPLHSSFTRPYTTIAGLSSKLCALRRNLIVVVHISLLGMDLNKTLLRIVVVLLVVVAVVVASAMIASARQRVTGQYAPNVKPGQQYAPNIAPGQSGLPKPLPTPDPLRRTLPSGGQYIQPVQSVQGIQGSTPPQNTGVVPPSVTGQGNIVPQNTGIVPPSVTGAQQPIGTGVDPARPIQPVQGTHWTQPLQPIQPAEQSPQGRDISPFCQINPAFCAGEPPRLPTRYA